MSNQTTGPSVFEIDQHTSFGPEIILTVLLDIQGDHVSESEFEEMFEESYSEEGEDDGNTDDEEIEGDDGNDHRKSIENLEKVKIQGFLMCSICLEEITPSDKEEEEGDVRIPKPCGHVYHHSCITKWLINHHTCPLCRFKITS
ncbi:hypothetical protein QN277_019446 [Acacia crassicarpa]|uniref:RING-type E3 ubiquitin transferase n=1 Tax=Acacia crassicarpa TaxID=499986 RepID=A0AAE1MQZ5_9FABA|nr:hypothetical protein QN277_019446 [Acacia crassicarpa]